MYSLCAHILFRCTEKTKIMLLFRIRTSEFSYVKIKKNYSASLVDN